MHDGNGAEMNQIQRLKRVNANMLSELGGGHPIDMTRG
ncbi:MAG: hypothetical protein Hyperionvirus42_1 [Hyperionvirus sp.]|uniref:Uncharacterized protein n=1 Tax=Hyperionvirus sp. TaxID=2487770 RepID=A0A3G5AC62_9VIRU|nr:MAG: hypothetical protein Hyperionvirus42_1 [Hyperionvirus sp.]